MCASVADRALDLPPLYNLVTFREAGDAFAHACAIAGSHGAGTLVWVRRYDLAEFAVVLEPDQSLAEARCALYAGMNALADALSAHAPPSRPITFDWPDAIRVDGVLVGGGRLGWPKGARENKVPDWIVFSGMIRTVFVSGREPGLRPLLGALDELGFDGVDSGQIIASFARHLMSAFDEWNASGFLPIANRWLRRRSPDGDNEVRIAENGDLLVFASAAHAGPERRHLGKALAAPSWLDPRTGTPWL